MKSIKGAALASLVAAASFAWAQGPAGTAVSAGSARAWLAANKSSAQFADRLIESAGAEEDLGRALLLIKDFEPYLKDEGDRFRTARLAASYAEAGGLTHEAARWYEKALASNPGARGGEIEYRLAVCRLKAGFAEDSLAIAERLSASADSALAARARLLSAWALAALGKRKDALARAASIAAGPVPAELEASVAYAIAYLGEGTRPSVPERTTASGQGSRDHPDAFLLAGLTGGKPASGGVNVLDEPVYYLSGISATPAPSPLASAAPSMAAATSPSPRATDAAIGNTPIASSARRIAGYLQAGAFSVKANAESLAKRVREAGYAAEIRERGTASGKTLYYVLLPRDEDGKPSSATLKKAGFETVPFPYE